MSLEKIKKAEQYLVKLKDRLSSAIPEKHKDHPDTYKSFLRNEIRVVQEQLDEAKLEAPKK